jgi:hypothetical protein
MAEDWDYQPTLDVDGDPYAAEIARQQVLARQDQQRHAEEARRAAAVDAQSDAEAWTQPDPGSQASSCYGSSPSF